MLIDRCLLMVFLATSNVALMAACSTGLAESGPRDGPQAMATYSVKFDPKKNEFSRRGGMDSVRTANGEFRWVENYLAMGKDISVDDKLKLDPDLLSLVSGALSYLESLPAVAEGDSRYPIPTSDIVRHGDSILVSEFDGVPSVFFKSESSTLIVYFSPGQDQFVYRYIVH